MSLFDSVFSAVTSHVQQQGGIAKVLTDLLADNGSVGGINGLATRFNQAGLGEVLNSWIGTGANQPISADQLSGVLGSNVLGNAASQMGLDPAQLAGQLATLLPGLVDKLTPQGQAPAGGLGNAGDLLGMLGGLLAK